ncbi:hypothetical protein F2P45_30150 [Massilia sp. CCM 8733]|uniref:Uncharacterized protein n=1 Tax=Massilia mucilaginosa TaxID=2609282 RepID=A0ABX0P2Z4_9BURK|nr:hypothetical protein [Massilia mucilaginosa]NHZ93241.1 hypothetical protein [Massilia mucilaginosa]
MKRQSIASHLPKLRVAAFAPLTVLLGMPLAYAADNLKLSNGTFEAGITPWKPVGSVISGQQIDCGLNKCLQLNVKNTTVTATSDVKAVVPGQFIAASARMKRTSTPGQEDVSLGIEFYGPNDVLIGTATKWSYSMGPANAWGDVKVSAIAPAGAESAKVVVRGKSTGSLTAYVDDVAMSRIILEDRGQQVFVGRVSAAAIDSNTLYVAANGNPAKFAYYRVSDGQPLKQFTLGNEDIWSVVVGGDSAAYFGTASGKLYRFSYNTDAAPKVIKEFKKAAGGTRTIWSLKAGPGNCIFGGLAPDDVEKKADGFKYCPDTEVTTMLPLPATTGVTTDGVTTASYHVRSLAVDLGGDNIPRAIYWGMGNPAKLYKSALDGSGMSAPLPIDGTKEYAYYTDFAKDRLFVRLTGASNWTVVLERSGKSAGAEVADINSIGISTLSPACTDLLSSSPCNNTVFYTKDLGPGKGTHLSSYRVDAGEETALAIQMGPAAAFAYAPYSGPTQLVSVLRDPEKSVGKIVRYNLADLYNFNKSALPQSTPFPAPETASGIRTLAVHNDKTYSSGFVNGAIGIGDATANPPVLVKEYLQAEGMAVLGNHLFIGGYPGAVIKSYLITDTGLEAKVTNDALGKTYGQNRPFAMLPVPKRNDNEVDRLVIATVPKVNEQGALAVYSVGNPGSLDVVKPFNGHSILALARIDDVVYGGTSVWRDIDNVKSDGFAKLFTFDPFKTLAVEEVNIEKDIVAKGTWNERAITALLRVNRQIWVLAEDTVLIYDHDTKSFVNKLQTPHDFSYEKWNIAWNAGSMVESNGYVYFSANDTKQTNIYRVNISKPDSIEVVRTGASGTLKVDEKGNIYFINEDKVMKYNMALQ